MNRNKKSLIGCIANFSEGRNRALITLIEKTLISHKKVIHLHTDIGWDANRTVLSFAGPPKALIDAAFDIVKQATLLIDMRNHKGEHPRIGATDVLPLIPLKGISEKDVNYWAIKLAKRIGSDLKIPVYLYGKIATSKENEQLPFIRKGEYEKLKEKMQNGFKPDFGPNEFNAKSGATAIGSRNLMLAFNVNLKSKNIEAAKIIAGKIRSSGIIIDCKKIEGKLKNVQAKGWIMKKYNCAQVTTNIHDLKATPIYLLYETVKEEAKKLNEEINGCELIGLVPEQALIETGQYYLEQQKNLVQTLENDQLINLAIKELGLEKVRPFNPELQIIEKRLENY